jgi:hypothetical protein
MYAYVSTEDGRRAYRHALWVPKAKLLFVWVPMSTIKQVFPVESFPPKQGVSNVTEGDECEVADEIIQEAKRYLGQEKHLAALERSVAKAQERISGMRRVNESRAQERFQSLKLEGS